MTEMQLFSRKKKKNPSLLRKSERMVILAMKKKVEEIKAVRYIKPMDIIWI